MKLIALRFSGLLWGLTLLGAVLWIALLMSGVEVKKMVMPGSEATRAMAQRNEQLAQLLKEL